jgi:replicative DNA helicase
MTNIAGSSRLSQDADLVIMLHEKEGQEHERERELEMIVAKNRGGRKGYENIYFDVVSQTFRPGGNGRLAEGQEIAEGVTGF